MADLNKVFLIGNLTRDPEVRYTPKGTAVGDLAMAINSSYKAQDGSTKEEVCYVDVVAWGRQAETCKEYLQKGAPVFVEGRLQFDSWETKDGEKRSRLRVRAERIQFLGRPRGNEGGPGGSPGGAPSSRSAGYDRPEGSESTSRRPSSPYAQPAAPAEEPGTCPPKTTFRFRVMAARVPRSKPQSSPNPPPPVIKQNFLLRFRNQGEICP